MKQLKKCLLVALSVMTMLLTGCGTQLYELTEEEESLIIHSAAYFVAKHNVQQKDGVNGVPLPDSFEEESESESEIVNEGDGTENGGEGVPQPDPSEDIVALAELIGHAGNIKISYEGSRVVESYKEGTAYVVDAEAGRVFYVMTFKLTNITGQDVTVNNAAKSPIVKMVSDAVTVKSEVTFLTSDFSTYQGTIKAGESVNTILLFEVSETIADKIVEPTLEITIGSSTKSIKL